MRISLEATHEPGGTAPTYVECALDFQAGALNEWAFSHVFDIIVASRLGDDVYSLKNQATPTLLRHKLQWLFTEKAASVYKTTHAERNFSQDTSHGYERINDRPHTQGSQEEVRQIFLYRFGGYTGAAKSAGKCIRRSRRVDHVEQAVPSSSSFISHPSSFQAHLLEQRQSSSQPYHSTGIWRSKISCSVIARHTVPSTPTGNSPLGDPCTNGEEVVSGAKPSAHALDGMNDRQNAVESAREMDTPTKPSRRTSANLEPPSKRL
jgi:hypothetical protein